MWRPGELLTEARRNLGPRQITYAVLAVALLTALGLLTAITANRALDLEQTRQRAGASVWVAYGTGQTGLDARRCDALRQDTGVASAGGLLTRGQDYYTFPGGEPVHVAAVTPGALTVWWPQAGTTALAVGSEVVDLGTISRGSQVYDGHGTLVGQVDHTLPATIPLSELRSSLIHVQPPLGTVSECWVRMEPGTDAAATGLLAAAFATDGARVAPFFENSVGSSSPSQIWQAIAGIRPWIVVAALLACAAGLVTLPRRGEFAIYRAFGTTRREIWQIVALETVMTTVPAAALAASLALVTSAALHHDTQSPLTSRATVAMITAAAGVTIALAPLVCALTMGRGLAAQLKDH